MKIGKFNKGNLKELRAKMRVALSGMEKEHGLSIDIRGGTYQEHEVTFKLKVSILNENGLGKQALEDFIEYAPHFGFDKEDFGRSFTFKGHQFTITGWNRRRHRYPVETISDEGLPWFFSPRLVLQALGKAECIAISGGEPPRFS